MSDTSVAACPGCIAGNGVALVDAPPTEARLALSLPGIHCQACIRQVEDALSAVDGVRSARVNLTLKRAMIDAAPEITAKSLAQRLDALGFEAHELDSGVLQATQTDRAGRELLMRLAVAGFASMNVMLLSVAVWSGASDATRDLFHWVSAAIALPAIAFCAQPFFRNAWAALSAGRLNMDVPITLAILLALATSLWETMLSGHHAYFDAALALTFFLLAGRYLDFRARAVARSAAEELAALEVPRAWRVNNGDAVEVQAAALRVGDMILVRPGGRIPVDGKVETGQSELDRSLLTGETLPVFVGPGQTVSAGEVNLTGPLTVRASAVGQDTSLHRLADLVAIAESGRARYTPLADAAAKLYAPGVHILAALSFLGWLLWSADMRTALNIAAAVLIITCPCALGLAVPAVTTAASGRLFRQGLLIKDATALERLARVDTVVFDKTGTLTAGQPQLIGASEIPPDVMALAMAMAKGSSHPLSQAIADAGQKAGLVAPQIRDLCEVPGFGTKAMYGDKQVRLGRAEWMGLPVPEHTAAFLQIGDAVPQMFMFEDQMRPGATELVYALKAEGIAVKLISGDTQGAVAALAGKLGIDDFSTGALPGEKAAEVARLAELGAKVLMVGDGLNDTVALRAAYVSMSPASALDAARAASDIVLLGSDLGPVADALRVSRKATARIKENFRIATIYNVIAVPIAVIGLATPLVAALAMSASSITVSLNALRVR